MVTVTLELEGDQILDRLAALLSGPGLLSRGPR